MIPVLRYWKRKMKNDGLEMPKEVVKYIAYNINSNIRELEGALISLLAQSSLNRREIDLDLSQKSVAKFCKIIQQRDYHRYHSENGMRVL